MFSRIVVPLDGSSFAEAALPAAVALAERFSVDVRLLRVRSPQWNDALVEMERSLDQEAYAYLAEVGTRVRALTTAHVSGDVEYGNPIDHIVSAADEPGDIIVMTSHGRGGLSRLWLGSVADAVVRRCERPVLIVRPSATSEIAPFGVDRVIVPLDGSLLGEAALPMAVLLAEAFGATLDLVTSVAGRTPVASGFVPATYWLPLPPEATVADAGKYLEEVAQRTRSSRLTPVVHVDVGPDPARAIHDAAGAGSLIVMTTHGHGGFRRVLVGSVADKVVRQAEGAVLVIRPVAFGEASDDPPRAAIRDGRMKVTVEA